MAKFLLGVVAGVVLVFLGFGLLAVALAMFQGRPPEVAANSVLVMRLRGDIPEKAPIELPAILGDSSPGLTVAGAWMALRKAAGDSRIKAVVVEPEGVGAGWAKLEELRSDLEQFRKSGKPVYAYLRAPGAREYYIALGAETIYLGPQEPLMLKGLRAEVMYFKGTLDKIGVSVEVEHAGRYKDFGDMFTRKDMSPETREVIDSVADGIYGNLVAKIAAARGKSPEQVRAIIDRGPFTASQAVAEGLADKLLFEDEMWAAVNQRLGGNPKRISIGAYVKVPPASAGQPGKSRIALVVAAGDILRGSPADDGEGETSITSYGFNKVLKSVANDAGIKGAIVRIDSPGGEVAASSEIWRQMNLLAKRKPLVISMSDAAASGGYYIAMTGDPIVAYPGTVTGSIGVVFGKPNLHGLYDKLGITKDAIERGRRAGIDSDYTPLTPDERHLLQSGIDDSYRDFVSKVAAARRRPFDAIEPLAQGRVWLGSQAQANGLVDRLGGLDTALDLVKQRAGIPAAERVVIDVYPPRASLLDLFMKRSSSEDVLEGQLTRAFGPVPWRAWMHGGLLGLAPYWFEVR